MGVATNAWRVLKTGGPVPFLRKVVERLEGPNRSRSLISREAAQAVDWSRPHPAVIHPIAVPEGPLTVAWIMSPPGEGSGGHQNIFRFISFMEDAGHQVQIYLHSLDGLYSVAQVTNMLDSSASFHPIAASIEVYTEEGVADGVHAIFATGWETAYPAFLDRSRARRLYFVQDFEPLFYPVGTEHVLAENTYRFGFSAITAGNWLRDKLTSEFHMPARSYQFSADRSIYSRTNEGPRKEVFFYARPGTTRRGFELGIMALELFARERPDYTINLAGWDVGRFDVPFAYNNLGVIPISELNALYNRCAAGLVLSLTNMSLLPLELLAAGVIPVVNGAPNNTEVSSNPFIEYASPSPRSLADRLIAIVDRPDLIEHSRRAAESVGVKGWEESGQQFMVAFNEVMRG